MERRHLSRALDRHRRGRGRCASGRRSHGSSQPSPFRSRALGVANLKASVFSSAHSTRTRRRQRAEHRARATSRGSRRPSRRATSVQFANGEQQRATRPSARDARRRGPSRKGGTRCVVVLLASGIRTTANASFAADAGAHADDGARRLAKSTPTCDATRRRRDWFVREDDRDTRETAQLPAVVREGVAQAVEGRPRARRAAAVAAPPALLRAAVHRLAPGALNAAATRAVSSTSALRAT